MNAGDFIRNSRLGDLWQDEGEDKNCFTSSSDGERGLRVEEKPWREREEEDSYVEGMECYCGSEKRVKIDFCEAFRNIFFSQVRKKLTFVVLPPFFRKKCPHGDSED